MNIPVGVFKKFNRKLFDELSHLDWLNNPTEIMPAQLWEEELESERYTGLSEEEIIKQEIARYEREYQHLKNEGDISVTYDNMFEEINVFFNPNFRGKLKHETETCFKYIQERHCREWIDYNSALLFVRDFDFPEKIEGIGWPSGRRDLITAIAQDTNHKSKNILRYVAFNDPSLTCRCEAMKGLFLLNDKEGLAGLLKVYPTLNIEMHKEYAFDFLVLATHLGIKKLEDKIIDVLEYRINIYAQRKSLMDSPIDVDNVFGLLRKYNIGAARQYAKWKYPTKYSLINEILETAWIEEKPKLIVPDDNKDIIF